MYGRTLIVLVCCAAMAACKDDTPSKNNGSNNGPSNNGTVNNGTPNNGTPNSGMPNNGTPNNGTPNNGTNPDNRPPTAVDDTATLGVNQSVLIDVLANDSDPDGDALTVVEVTVARNGQAALEGGRIRYAPNANFGGVDSFEYTIEDTSGARATARVRITIETGPIAVDDEATAQPGETLVIQALANDSHPLGGSLTIVNVEDPPGGTATTDGTTVTYVSNAGFSGVDLFDYTVADETGAQATATIAVDVNARPVANPDSAMTAAATPVVVDVLANDSDPDGDMLTVENVTAPLNGQATTDGTTVTYTPNAAFGGNDTFQYSVSDGHGNTVSAVVSVAVNSLPVANDDATKVFVDQSQVILVLANDTDADGDAITVTGVTQPVNGSATTDGMSVTYTPTVGFEGTDAFGYTISDGRGGTDTATVTVVVEPPYRGLRLSAGWAHNCAVRSDDTVMCWGDGSSGKLGAGGYQDSATPLIVGSATDWQSVAAGQSHTCGVRQNGTLWCWGSNSDYVFGTNVLSSTNVPLQVGSDTDWRLVSSGYRHSCAVKETGELYCGGWNLDGEVGVGSSSLWVENYGQVGADANWWFVSAGDGHTCGLKGIGELWCWGDNGSDQLGDPMLDEEDQPVRIGTETTWQYLSAGRYYTCGIKQGALLCWGSGYQGQLGTGGASNVPVPTQIGSATNWTEVSAGSAHTCGLRGGELYCWGGNTFGQLGDGTTVQRLNPLKVGTGSDWAHVSVGEGHTCAQKNDGSYHCWGHDQSGALGDGSVPGALVPTRVDMTNSWVAIATGAAQTCGVRSDQTLWCWGANNDGQLGNGATLPAQTPTQSGFSTDWTSIHTGPDFFCSIKTDDSMWCWGNNWLGMLGDGSRTSRSNPTRIGGSATWSSMNGGSQHSCGTQLNGTMWCWGRNSNGQLAQDPALTESLVPVQVGTATDWEQTSVGRYLSCGIRGGQLWCWGDSFATTVTQIGTDADWRQISIGEDRLCAVKDTNTLWCWDPTRNQMPNLVVSDTDWDVVDAESEDHACAIKADGSLWCWGDNDYGQLGDGTTIAKTTPNPIGSATWLSVTTGGGTFGGHTCGIQMDGSLWCWGNDESGQLGLGDVWVTAPQPVVAP